MAPPRFSIITPVYETPAPVLRAMLRSVRRQTFEDWELCLVDDASTAPHVAALLERAQRRDQRIKVRRREANGGIVAASNDALAMAGGEFVALLDHDDKLHPEALSLVAAALEAEPEADYAYTDEDKIDERGLVHTGPFCKPDWSPERLRTQMYTCHFSVLRRSLVEAVGGFDPEFEGSQDWDLVLKVTERARRVVHVPRILYHWRALETSTAGRGVEAKPWAFEAGRRAVQAHCGRVGLQAEVERDEDRPGVYHLRPALTSKPKVSILIPTNGQRREVRYRQVTLVEHCVRSIVESSSYGDYEIVCVADAETDPGVLSRLGDIAGDRLRVVPYDGAFNFAAKINLGAAHAKGELLLLLNDDIEVISSDWLERMVMYAQHPEIGAVGAQLIWEDGRVQHAGVYFEGGLPGHPFYGFTRDFKGYANNTHLAQNLLAVTGACLMTSAAAFEQVGGLSTELPVNYNDVDYCLKLGAQGFRVVYDPDTLLYHFESSSRSSEVADWEKQYLLTNWRQATAKDPVSHPYLAQGMPRLRAHLGWAVRRPRLRR
ncbi:MAG TPA: glycosyltransferase [Solirubrobacterales bacterium]